MVVDIDHLRSNGHSVGRNGHGTHAERQPRQVNYPRLLALGRELLLAIGEDPEREGLEAFLSEVEILLTVAYSK